MQVFFDRSLMKAIFHSMDAVEQGSLDLILGKEWEAELPWPALLEYLELGEVLQKFPPFDASHPLFSLIAALLPDDSQQELLIEAYDRVFVECLTYVQALPEINASFLLEKLANKKAERALHPLASRFASSLARYEEGLKENQKNYMHSLILYLGWDRALTYLSAIFEYPLFNGAKGCQILLNSLTESFQHITAQGRASPGFFRLAEALYAYQMRAELLDRHSETDWALLCQSGAALRPRELLSDIWYIDAALASQSRPGKKEPFKVVTVDSEEKIEAGLRLSHYAIDKFKQQRPDWDYLLERPETISLEKWG